MQISDNLRFVVLAMLCTMVPGCNNGRQAAPASEKRGQMKARIVERDSFFVMGTLTRMTAAEETGEKYAEIWNNFELYNVRIKPISTDRMYYGVCFTTKQKDVFDYLAGMAVRDDAAPPDKQLVIRNVPAARYAIFQCPVQEIGQTYQYILNQWLPSSRYETNKTACSFEQYPPEEQEGLPVLIHIPISEKKAQQGRMGK